MRIVVLAKEVPDTWSNRKLNLETGLLDRQASDPVADEINERALENALRYRDAGGEAEITVLTMGPEQAEASVRKLLAMGADTAVIVADTGLAGADMKRTAEVLAAAITKIGADLVLAGDAATDGRGGLVPPMVAELLGWPVLPALETLQIQAAGAEGTVPVDGETIAVRSTFPLVAAITEKTAEARFPNFKGIMRAKKKPLTVWSLSDLDVASQGPAQSVMVSAVERPAKTAGPKIEDDGTAAEQLAEFLQSNRLL
ncbi:electron transfer flavoprotein subunit beta/FixA family protein [Paenarthrobacter sp. NPDC058040]|uniref:electron transfer flavoprotein subunit beta/FixA family protein n=1 Tax=unclassified Paenarthrobacter TaxID=2634190 RepID=UPI0036DC339C